MIAIVDYGMGNIHSVQKALEICGAKTIVTHDPRVIKKCLKIVLPGVGAFHDAISELKRQNLVEAIKEAISDKKPFLGICLGMQLLFEKSQEAEKSPGLSIFKGEVVGFEAQKGLKIPHMGWNNLEKHENSCLLLKDIADLSYVYFCHSYYPKPFDNDVIAASCNYGVNFAAVVHKDNIYGVQFHPEKSQSQGLKMIDNFVKLC
jgi:glutamine amidotransferase